MQKETSVAKSIRGQLLREPESSMRDVLNILFRHKLLIIVTFLIVSVITTVVTLLTPKVYQSNAQILLRVGREDVSLDPTIEGPKLGIYKEKDKETKSEVAILNSRILAEKVAKKLGPDFILSCSDLKARDIHAAPPEQATTTSAGSGKLYTAVNRIMGGLSVNHQKETNIIDLSFATDNPYCAQTFLDEIIKEYLDRHIEVNRMLAAPSFFQEQADSLHRQLINKEQELKDYRFNNDITSIQEQKDSLIRQIETLQNQLDITVSGALASGVKISAYESNLGRRSPNVELYRTTGNENLTAKDLKNQLSSLRLQETDLAGRYQDDYRPLVLIREKISYIESLLSHEYDTLTEVTSGLSETYQSLETALETEKANFKFLLAQQEAVSNLLRQRKQELKDLSEKEVKLKEIERDATIYEKEYLSYRENLQLAKVNDALDMSKVSNVKIVQPATLSFSYIKPKRKVNILIGLVVGLLGGVGLAFVIEFFDDTMKTNEDVEKRLGIPVLAHVSKEEFESCL